MKADIIPALFKVQTKSDSEKCSEAQVNFYEKSNKIFENIKFGENQTK